ncbi:MAG: 2'-5' RNA ligase family protein [Bryobacteraceae bacterium]|nr:2'-5' RNA ligase family protein [Bryobacteraceae bacterium]
MNQYAVVSYIPEPLGDFITQLRQELVSGCVAQSHVTILPPRPLEVDASIAESDLRRRSAQFPAFDIEVPRIRVFSETSVIFADISRGRKCFFDMHDVLNSGPLYFDEPHTYHPHITLAQGLDPDTVAERYEMAFRRWTESAPKGPVSIENLTFVQNTSLNRWVDHAELELRGALVI